MLEGAVMEYAKWIVGIFAVSFVSVAVVLLFKLNDMSSFQQEVNYAIERHGGLTEEALIDLNDRTKSFYGGCLITSESLVGRPSGNGGVVKSPSKCLFPEDVANNVPHSGFSVQEYVMDANGKMSFLHGFDTPRPSNNRLVYGDSANYVLVRGIGSMFGDYIITPYVAGEAASRIRGDR